MYGGARQECLLGFIKSALSVSRLDSNDADLFRHTEWEIGCLQTLDEKGTCE